MTEHLKLGNNKINSGDYWGFMLIHTNVDTPLSTKAMNDPTLF